MGNKVIYDISGTLEEVLCVVKEIRAITGMEPVEIIPSEDKQLPDTTEDC